MRERVIFEMDGFEIHFENRAIGLVHIKRIRIEHACFGCGEKTRNSKYCCRHCFQIHFSKTGKKSRAAKRAHERRREALRLYELSF